MLEMAWERRADFVFSVEPLAGSIARAKRLQGYLSHGHGDNFEPRNQCSTGDG